MKKFKIIIEEFVSDEFVVYANSEEEAINKAIKNYYDCKFVLDSGCVTFKQLFIEHKDNKKDKWIPF